MRVAIHVCVVVELDRLENQVVRVRPIDVKEPKQSPVNINAILILTFA